MRHDCGAIADAFEPSTSASATDNSCCRSPPFHFPAESSGAQEAVLYMQMGHPGVCFKRRLMQAHTCGFPSCSVVCVKSRMSSTTWNASPKWRPYSNMAFFTVSSTPPNTAADLHSSALKMSEQLTQRLESYGVNT